VRLLTAYLPLFAWAAVVLFVGTVPASLSLVPSGGWDKVAHFLMYGAGGALAAWTGRVRGPREGLLALLAVLAIGAADELHQSTLATRHADLLDWFADAGGALLFFMALRRWLPEKGTYRS
jgi:VanZ family protein